MLKALSVVDRSSGPALAPMMMIAGADQPRQSADGGPSAADGRWTRRRSMALIAGSSLVLWALILGAAVRFL